jgi:hypothetical protein
MYTDYRLASGFKEQFRRRNRSLSNGDMKYRMNVHLNNIRKRRLGIKTGKLQTDIQQILIFITTPSSEWLDWWYLERST